MLACRLYPLLIFYDVAHRVSNITSLLASLSAMRAAVLDPTSTATTLTVHVLSALASDLFTLSEP